ncbi:hypothetical protein C4901_15360 [Acidiferrobacter sp. SPIII_3]|jgi:hypothetical protein|uniref:hypothetical protein n=1 Tax=Acidiferrobacter sp. SPIII_3 TaxID=1281578 RepID=UPI000D727FE5|nr:hypothetical protein [Acidiferrobacter sp. SPIII_3]AWP24533.1 hypothetical protein C4901_15360 [Acidiferrobacter sp. SPIII_3]
MTDTHHKRREGTSAIGHAAASGFRRARALFFHLIIDLVAIAVLTTVMGDTDGAGWLAIAIVVGAEIGLRHYEKRKSGQFGDTARGTEVQDHTKEGN